MQKVLIVLTGGIESTTLASVLKSQGFEVAAMFHNFGNNSRELEAASLISERLHVPMELIDFSCLYSEAAPPITFLPVAMAHALHHAQSIGAKKLLLGYEKDQSPKMTALLALFRELPLLYSSLSQKCALVSIELPFLSLTKAEVIKLASRLGTPLELTWSCSLNQEEHCGTCDSCMKRKSAFHDAAIEDPTIYID